MTTLLNVRDFNDSGWTDELAIPITEQQYEQACHDLNDANKTVASIIIDYQGITYAAKVEQVTIDLQGNNCVNGILLWTADASKKGKKS